MTTTALPGIVAVEHFSSTVPDLEQAVRFFVEVLGAVDDGVRHEFSAADGYAMDGTFNAHPAASARLARLDLHGTTYELFQYEAPDLTRSTPRNCDVGGHHLGLRVSDLDAAVAQLRRHEGVRMLGEPTWQQTPVLRGWVYFLTPWGMQMELAEEHPTPGGTAPGRPAGSAEDVADDTAEGAR